MKYIGSGALKELVDTSDMHPDVLVWGRDPEIDYSRLIFCF